MIATNPFDIFGSVLFTEVIKLAILTFLVLYAIFALIIVRQVDLMGKTLKTPVAPIIKAIAIIHAGFAVGFVVLVVGLLR